jgi:hypothetical protein
MPTAIVSAYTPEGFVIGADGLRREAKTNEITTRKAIKLHFTETSNGCIGYAWAGTTSILADGASFNFIQESESVAKDLAATTFEYFPDYTIRFTDLIYQHFNRANLEDKFAGNLALIAEGKVVCRIVFVGYFLGAPWRARFEVTKKGKVLTGIHLIDVREKPIDFDIFSGSELMKDKFQPRLDFAPATLKQATDLVRDYIQRCIDNPYHDKECEEIGGRIHIAAITPRGFHWIQEPLTDP